MSNSRRKTAVVFLNGKKKWRNHTHSIDKILRATKKGINDEIPSGGYYKKMKRLCFVKCIPLFTKERMKIWWSEFRLEYKILIK